MLTSTCAATRRRRRLRETPRPLTPPRQLASRLRGRRYPGLGARHLLEEKRVDVLPRPPVVAAGDRAGVLRPRRAAASCSQRRCRGLGLHKHNRVSSIILPARRGRGRRAVQQPAAESSRRRSATILKVDLPWSGSVDWPARSPFLELRSSRPPSGFFFVGVVVVTGAALSWGSGGAHGSTETPCSPSRSAQPADRTETSDRGAALAWTLPPTSTTTSRLHRQSRRAGHRVARGGLGHADHDDGAGAQRPIEQVHAPAASVASAFAFASADGAGPGRPSANAIPRKKLR